MSHNAPDTTPVDTVLTFFFLVLLKLVVGKDFQSKACAEKTYSKPSEQLGLLWFWTCLVGNATSFDSGCAKPEWQDERQRDERLEDSFWQEKREKCLVPKAICLLGFRVPWVIGLPLPATCGNTVEQTTSPSGDSRQEKLVRPWKADKSIGD